MDDILKRIMDSMTPEELKYDQDSLIKAYKLYPKPKLRVGDIFISNCESSVSRWNGVEYNMKKGDKVLVMGCVPIRRFDGTLVSKGEEGPYWCYMFKNLFTGVEFEMQGHPALLEIIPRSEASEALYE